MKKTSKAPILAVLRPLSLPQHELEVELALPAEVTAAGAVLTLPTWTPGSYLVRDYARLVDRVELRDQSGKRHPAEKVDKQSWRLPRLPGGGRLRYRVFCNDLTVRTNHVDAQHAQLVGAATFLHVQGETDRPYEIRFEGFPDAWKVATALPLRGGCYRAQDFDALVDSPFELGQFRLHKFQSLGARFEVAITGEHPGAEDRILAAIRRIVETCGDLFGGFPFRRYLFLLTFAPGARGGLEHRDSTLLLHDPHTLAAPAGYTDLYTLIAHEFFHVWNVKRIRDARLGPFDYSQENPSRLLWFHEGLTSFMQYLIVLRAGVVPFVSVARSLAATWTENVQRPGRHEQSLEESSFDAWIRQYKPNEFSPNSTVGYYDKGSLVGWLMDAMIRLGSKGKHGLEDLFQLLWTRHGDAGIGDQDLRRAYEDLSGGEAAPFWDAYIGGRTELDCSPIEAAYGLSFEARAPWETLAAAEAEDPLMVARAKVYAGLVMGKDRPTVLNVLPGSPAFAAGLSYGMEILAVDGWRVTASKQVQDRLQDRPVGARAEVLAEHLGRVRSYPVTLALNPSRTYRIAFDPGATARQRAAFQASTGQSFPPLRAVRR
jgi:predicted metalloprotease with PDZ domain